MTVKFPVTEPETLSRSVGYTQRSFGSRRVAVQHVTSAASHSRCVRPFLVTILRGIRLWKISFVDEYIYLLAAGYVTSNIKVVGESRTGKYVEGSGFGSFCSTILYLEGLGEQRKTSSVSFGLLVDTRTRNFTNVKHQCVGLDSLVLVTWLDDPGI